MITLDVNRCFVDLKTHLTIALMAASSLLMNIMQNEIPGGNLPGKPEWREKLRRDIRILNAKMADTFASVSVGIPYEDDSPDFIKAMLINHGGGNKSDFNGERIHTFPGKLSWDGNLDAQRVSPNVRHAYYLPRGFNQKGSHYFENSMRIIQKQYFRILENALANFDFTRYVTSDVTPVGRR